MLANPISPHSAATHRPSHPSSMCLAAAPGHLLSCPLAVPGPPSWGLSSLLRFPRNATDSVDTVNNEAMLEE